MKITLLDPIFIQSHWDTIERLLSLVVAESFDEVSLAGLKDRLLSGREAALGAIDDQEKIACICVLGVSTFETGKRCLEVPYIAGNGRELWLEDGWRIIKDLAISLQCSHIRGSGRDGWQKILPQMKKIRTIYECQV